MKTVPFYANHSDNLHCMLASYKSILDYFYGEKLSWEELEQLAGFNKGRPAWSLKMLTYLANRGLKIRMIEPFNYERYFKEDQKYLDEFYTPEEKEWNLNKTNLAEIKPLIPSFLAGTEYECRRATLTDVESMLGEGMIVFAVINPNILIGKTGYSSHSVLIFEKNEDDYIMHDPGLPAIPNCRVNKEKFFEAMGGITSTHELTGFKLETV